MPARPGTRDAEDCLVLLTPMRRLNDWEHDPATTEIRWSASFVKHCASIVAIELVALLQRARDGDFQGGIHVVGFLNGFLGELKAFWRGTCQGCAPRPMRIWAYRRQVAASGCTTMPPCARLRL